MHFKSIASRIIVTVLPIVAFFTLLSVALIYVTMNEQIENQFGERMNESLGSAELSIHTELVMNASIAQSLAIYAETCSRESIERGELADFLTRTIPSNKNTVGGGIWYEPYALHADQRYFSAYVYVKYGTPIYAPNYSSEVDYHNTSWYINGKNAKEEVVWSDVYYDPVAEVTMITASVPFYSESGDFLGVTTADMALTDIKAISSAISVGETGAAFILGAKGEFISFLDDSRGIDRLIAEDEDSELAALGRKILVTQNGSATLHWEGAERSAYFTTIGETGWHLVVLIDNAELGHSANTLILPLAIGPVAGLILAVLSIIFVARSLTRVADKVNRFANQAASGDLSERIAITEHDEFGVMEGQLNRMMDNMAEMTEKSEKALQMAQSANKAKSAFLSRMSHEMRTPMNAIIGMVQIAERTADEDMARIRDCLDKIDNASRNLLELINNVLDMAKIEANKVELEIIRFSVAEVFRSISKVFWVKAEEGHLFLSFEVSPALPEYVLSDRFRYQQVLTNLISNAVKFTPEGGAIAVYAEMEEETETTAVIRTTVRDTGIGVDPAIAGRLFVSFEQAESSILGKHGGTGLGLSISKSLVQLMGGEIWYEPVAGGGSAFSFTITADKAPEEDLPEESLAEIERDYAGRRVLLVEDIEINREIVAALLGDTGLALDFAENGKEACEKFSADPEIYDLIFMDIQMPVMDGLEAARRIRALSEGSRVPIIAMSANAFKDDVDASLGAGMNGHISKPVDLDILLGTLDNVFSAPSARSV